VCSEGAWHASSNRATPARISAASRRSSDCGVGQPRSASASPPPRASSSPPPLGGSWRHRSSYSCSRPHDASDGTNSGGSWYVPPNCVYELAMSCGGGGGGGGGAGAPPPPDDGGCAYSRQKSGGCTE
jgi:hypothetical protein